MKFYSSQWAISFRSSFFFFFSSIVGRKFMIYIHFYFHFYFILSECWPNEQQSKWMMHDRKSRMNNKIDNKFRNKSVMMKYWNKKKREKFIVLSLQFRILFRWTSFLSFDYVLHEAHGIYRNLSLHLAKVCFVYALRYFTFRIHEDEKNDICFRNI